MGPLNAHHLQTLFNKLDTNGDGLVSLDDLTWLLEKTGACGVDRLHLELLVGKEALDSLDFVFFYQTLMLGDYRTSSNCGEKDLEAAFRVFDLNEDGLISWEELEVALSRLGVCEGGQDCKTMIRKYDVNDDGVLDFDEFKIMMMMTSS